MGLGQGSLYSLTRRKERHIYSPHNNTYKYANRTIDKVPCPRNILKMELKMTEKQFGLLMEKLEQILVELRSVEYHVRHL